MNEIKLTTPLTDEKIKDLKAGDSIKLSGYIYTARDSAHARLFKLVEEGKELPFDIKGAVIYYVGPSPTMPNQVIGSAGPTTSYRMDAYAPTLLDLGLKGMIGKGQRNKEVREAITRNKGIYFGATGGAAALIAKAVKENELVAYEDLGPEAIRKLYVEDFPLTVINDIYGNDLYDIGKEQYKIVEDK